MYVCIDRCIEEAAYYPQRQEIMFDRDYRPALPILQNRLHCIYIILSALIRIDSEEFKISSTDSTVYLQDINDRI